MSKRAGVWDHAQICRMCLQNDGFLLPIFNNHLSASHSSIVKKIIECTALEPSSGDGLPPCICHRCMYKVEICVEFKQLCRMSYETLRRVTNTREEGGSEADTDPLQRTPTVSIEQFEQFSRENERLLQELRQPVQDVVMVVNPDMDYESENESDCDHHSDMEGQENTDLAELRNVFMCKYCDRAFTIRELCEQHERDEHRAEAPFPCLLCDMAFADRTNYTAHQKSVHRNDKPFDCPQCNRCFSRRSDLRKHTVVHTGIKPFTCSICCKSFSRNTNLTKHLRIHSGHKPYVCPQCPKTFISKGDLTRHALIHSGHKPFSCSYCDQTFGRRDKLVRHEKRHFSNNTTGGNTGGTGGVTEGSATAAATTETARNQTPLDYHHRLTNYYSSPIKQEADGEEDGDEEPWTGEKVVISVDPFNHDDVQVNKDDDDDEGSGSSRETSNFPRIPEHITADDDLDEPPNPPLHPANTVKKYPCLVCHKRFSTAESLRFHNSIHSSHKQHACPQCSKSFLRKRELDRHVATHTGLKPYKCTDCEKRFGRKDKLVRHMRIHQPCAPYNDLYSSTTPRVDRATI